MAATVYAVCNQKGGCAKTVTSVNFGIGLAREGKKVLLIDMDAQGSMTASLGYQQPDRLEATLSDILGGIINDTGCEFPRPLIIAKEVAEGKRENKNLHLRPPRPGGVEG